MYEIDGVEYTQNDVDYNAKLQGLTSKEWLKQNGFTASEGKTNGSTETPPTEPVKNTAAGDSSSADISLESLEEFDLSNLPKIVKETDTYMGVNSDFDVSDVRGPEKPLSKKILRFSRRR